MADLPENPNNREEEYLADMAGENGTKPANPWSRKEAYLDAIDGRMDGIEEQIAALATDISLKGSVASQTDLPETAAVGDAYITEDTGIMYVYVGESGTEPWVALGGSGGGEGVKTLTEADYNYPADNPTSVALWLLPAGIYKVADPLNDQVKIASNVNNYGTPYGLNSAIFMVLYTTDSIAGVNVYILGYRTPDNGSARIYCVRRSNGGLVNQMSLALEDTAGNSSTSAMTQNATTSMVFADPSTRNKVQIGNSNTSASADRTVAIGPTAYARGGYSIGIGNGCASNGSGSIALGSNAIAFDVATGGIALGAYSKAEVAGQIDVGSTNTTYGYDSTNYRLLTGVYDPVDDHDAATKGYVDAHSGGSITLTSDDYDYPENNPTGIAVWLLEPGIYTIDATGAVDGKVNLKTYNSSNQETVNGDTLIVGGETEGSYRSWLLITSKNGMFPGVISGLVHKTTGTMYSQHYSGGLMGTGYIKDNLTTNDPSFVLSANQGKVLKDLIDALDARVTALGG